MVVSLVNLLMFDGFAGIASSSRLTVLSVLWCGLRNDVEKICVLQETKSQLVITAR